MFFKIKGNLLLDAAELHQKYSMEINGTKCLHRKEKLSCNKEDTQKLSEQTWATIVTKEK